jgi:hypothetical protein
MLFINCVQLKLLKERVFELAIVSTMPGELQRWVKNNFPRPEETGSIDSCWE